MNLCSIFILKNILNAVLLILLMIFLISMFRLFIVLVIPKLLLISCPDKKDMHKSPTSSTSYSMLALTLSTLKTVQLSSKCWKDIKRTYTEAKRLELTNTQYAQTSYTRIYGLTMLLNHSISSSQPTLQRPTNLSTTYISIWATYESTLSVMLSTSRHECHTVRKSLKKWYIPITNANSSSKTQLFLTLFTSFLLWYRQNLSLWLHWASH